MAGIDFSEIDKYSGRYKKDPKSRVFVQLAEAYRKKNMIDEALEILDKGLQYHPQYPIAYLIQGKCFFDKRKYVQAKASFEKVLTLDAQNIVALRMLAQTCDSLNDEAGQISAYKDILAIDPSDTSVKEKLNMLTTTQKKTPIYTISMAAEYERQGNISEALAIYEHLLTIDPTDLVLQEKVKECKQKAAEEEKKSEQEKLAGLKFETFFKPEDLEKKEKFKHPESEISPTTNEPNFPEVQEKLIKQEKETVEKVQPLEDFLIKESPEKPEETEPEPAVQIEEKETQKPIKIEEFLIEPEKTKVEEETVVRQPQKVEEPRSAEIPIENETSQVEKNKEPETSSQEAEQTPKKPKEEDFKSFQEWLSGLLK